MRPVFAKRQYVIAGIFTVVCLIYLARLFYLQIIDIRYKLSADNNVFRYVTEYPARGLVFDRKDQLLVYNEASYDLMVVPKQLKSFDTTDLCWILNISKETLKLELKKAYDYSVYKPSVVYKQITSRRFAYLHEKLYKFPGFYVQKRSSRRYPRSIAAHVLGYIREVDPVIVEKDSYYKPGDYIGISGIEKSYEAYLRGVKGLKIYMVDVHNRIKGSYANGKYDSAAVVGRNITTTLDADLQEFGEKLMINKRGSIVAIEPKTGEILALVSSPGYNPNLLVGSERSINYPKLVNDELKPMFNRAVMAYYPPGSTFKLVNALIGLQEKVINTSSVFSCGGGFNIGNHIVKCHHGGGIDFLRSISGSCNTYYCNVFNRIIMDKKFKTVADAHTNWRNHVLSFGLGKKLGSDLSQELEGIIYKSSYYNKYYGIGRWKAFTIISMAIGQGELGFTPLQMANMTATIANHGYYVIPHVVKEIDGEPNIPNALKERHYTKIDSIYYSYVIDGMEQVLVSGTGRSAFFDKISICGKTGTAQNPHGDDHSIFVAFAPKDDPKIAISVYVENAGFGSTYAAPIASLMIEKYLTDTITRPLVVQKILETNLLYSKTPTKKK